MVSGISTWTKIDFTGNNFCHKITLKHLVKIGNQEFHNYLYKVPPPPPPLILHSADVLGLLLLREIDFDPSKISNQNV